MEPILWEISHRSWNPPTRSSILTNFWFYFILQAGECDKRVGGRNIARPFLVGLSTLWLNSLLHVFPLSHLEICHFLEIKGFYWIACLNKISTSDNLNAWLFTMPNMYFLCQKGEESVDHLLLNGHFLPYLVLPLLFHVSSLPVFIPCSHWEWGPGPFSMKGQSLWKLVPRMQ